MPSPTDIWTSLETTKLIVSFLTPVIIVFIGVIVNKRLKKLEHRQWRNQKLIEKRLDIYDDIAPLLNDVLCYYTYVGNWKDPTPLQIINLKRVIDKKIYLARPLLCEDFFTYCMDFMNLCYEPFTGWGEDAKLRTQFQRRQDAIGTSWDKTWNSMFSDNNLPDIIEIRKAYNQVMNIFSQEIGLQNRDLYDIGIIPANIK